MEKFESINDMCRSCLENVGCISVFARDDDISFSDMLFACTSIKLLAGESGPDQICGVCICRLRDAFLFRGQCLRSETKIRNSTLDIKPDLLLDTKNIIDPQDNLQDALLDIEDRHFYEEDLPLIELKYSEFRERKTKGDNDRKQKKADKKSDEAKVRKKKTVDLDKLNRKIKKLEKLSQIKDELQQSAVVDNGNVEEFCQGAINAELMENKLIDNGLKKQSSKKKKTVSNGNINSKIKQEIVGVRESESAKLPEKNIEQLYYGSDIEEMKAPVKKIPRSRSKGQYFCDLCGHCARVKWDLIIHFRKHTGEKPYKCDTCGKSFAHDGGLRTHQKQHTGAAKSFMCDVCGKGLSTKDTLLAHRRLHTGELPYTCPTCGRAFRALTNLRSHRRIHTGDKRHPCPVCGKLFYTKSDMRDHARRHTGERPYACSLCPQRFTGKSNHRLHMKIHAGQRDFQCPQCPKTFVSRDSMRRHGFTHSGERSYECLECGRRFTHRSSLVSHRAIHSKTKDYVCDICNQRFGYPSGLYVHRKKKHNIQSTRFVTPAV